MALHVVVFGGTQGIGLAIARKFARHGHHVTVLSRSLDKVNRAVLVLNEERTLNDQRFTGQVCDISVEESVAESFQAIRGRLNSVDVLVNSAAVNVDNLLIKTRQSDVMNQINVNLVGTINTCKNATKLMLRQNYGSIINIGSIVGSHGNQGQTIYAATKSALIGFTKSLAKEVARKGITANVIAPGFIDTEFATVEQKNAILERIPLQRLGTVDDVADVAFFLTQARYITGQVVSIDGGLSMNL